MNPAHATTSSIGILILRVGVGGLMLTHGWGKLQMVLAGDFDKFDDFFGMGPTASLLLITGAEFFCALLVVAGLLTRIAAVPVVIGMSVAAFFVHANDPWTMGEGARLFTSGAAPSWNSKEPALLFMFPFLALVFLGAGRFSLDYLVWQRRKGAVG